VDEPVNLLDQISFNTAPGSEFEDHAAIPALTASPLVRLVAFYLPQFHAIPENDSWWGKGFTEWTNVTKAVPRFEGHYQPRLPGALGFYDATDAETLRRQAALAKQAGITGFCFHHYWFHGRRLLERPLETLLANPDIDLPFCVNWANESWSRRWDSREQDILVAQEYSDEDDLAFARSLERLFRDPRYIKVDGRPLLLIYRPGLLPNAVQTVARWREHFQSAGIGDPYIAMVQTHGDGDPRKHGMDAAVGFPPFWAGLDLPMRQDLKLFDPRFYGVVRDYEALAQATIAGFASDKRTFPGVCPSWDNEARRPGRGICFTGSTPSLYGSWLKAACVASMRNFVDGERLVFINAWNEWAEGAYLEPDRHYGYAYLAETARVVSALSPDMVNDASNVKASVVQTKLGPKPTLMRRARYAGRQALNVVANIAEEIAWKLRGR
jgi:lipopolysaccharide biosynthesis protein